MVAIHTPQLVEVAPKVSDVLLVEYSPGVHTGVVFIGRVVHRGRKWLAAPLQFGSFDVDPNRTRQFTRQRDAVDWLVTDMMDQIQTVRSAHLDGAGEA